MPYKKTVPLDRDYFLIRFQALIIAFLLANLLFFSVDFSQVKQASAAVLPSGFKDSLITDTLINPTVVRFASDGRMFVAEKSGIIKVFKNISDTSSPVIFADLSTEVYNYWDRGLLGMTLAPNFPTDPYVYVLYAYDAPPGGTAPYWNDTCPTPPGANTDGCLASGHLSRLKAQGDTMVGPEELLISDWCQQFPSHSLGDLAFDSSGAIIVSAGEGASYTSVDYGQYGATLSGDVRNPCGDPPGGVNGTMTPPTARGGALRSQSLLRPAGEAVTLSGTILRVNPATGAGMPDNPGAASSDPNTRRIIAYGLRNPFRFTLRPGTDEVWAGDVGFNSWEELNRITNPTASVKNFGWPCYEGVGRQNGYEAVGLTMCENLYATPAAVTAPYYNYFHSTAVTGQNCSISTSPPATPQNSISSSTTGIAFYNGGGYPSAYDKALFFADYSRACVWVMFKDQNGNPDPSTIIKFVDGVYAPIQILTGPGGDLYTVGLIDGHVRRVQYQAPTTDIGADVYSGTAPLPVHFSHLNSSSALYPPDQLTYSWDLNGDGTFGDSTQPNPTYTYTQPGTYKAWVRVTDPAGKWSNSGRVQIVVNNTAPNPVISAPSTSLTWKVGQAINFAGSATDTQDGNLPASKLSWTFIINHCPSTCHQHVVESVDGVSSGSFIAPDHEYPSTMEIKLTATDSGGLTATTSVILNPQTVDLTFNSSPSGLQIVLNTDEAPTPFTRTIIAGSTISISAPLTQTLSGTIYTFNNWSDNLAQSHTVVANSSASYTANYLPCDPLLVNMSEDTIPGGDCQVTLRRALSSAPTNATIRFIQTMEPITLVSPLTVPSGITLISNCQSKTQIKVNAVNQLRLLGNNTLEGLDIRLNSGGTIEYAGNQLIFSKCNSIHVFP